MMVRKMWVLIGSLSFAQACSAEPAIHRTFGFARSETGWKAVDLNDLQNHLESSRVTCSGPNAEIQVVWNSESGDWAAFDKYSTETPYFARVIRFAQFNSTITIVKIKQNSQPKMSFSGNDALQYKYLLKEFKIWNKIGDVPFIVPQCARRLYLINDRQN